MADQSASTAKTRRSYSIIVLLFALALLGLVPAFLYAATLLYQNNQAQRDVVRNLAVSATRATSEAVDREIEGLATTLKVLSASTLLYQGDLEAFYTRSIRALEGSDTFLLVLEPDGQQVLNTRRPFGSELPKSGDTITPKIALETGELTVSQGFLGAVAQQPVFDVLMPMRNAGGAQWVIMLGQNASSLRPALTRASLPAGWTGALVDANNMLMTATSLDMPAGEDFFMSNVADIAAGDSWEVTRKNGENYVVAAEKSEISGWYVVTWASEEVIDKPLLDSVIWLSMGGIVIGLLTVAAIYLVARGIARSVRTLAYDARHFGQRGDLPQRYYAVTEFVEISQALSDAARHRQEAEKEIELLMREVAHRAKNQLSVIQSMAKQTANSSLGISDFLDDFQKRIIGLARSTDLLLSQGTTGIVLKDLIEAQIQPFRPDSDARFKVEEGPRVLLSSAAAQNMGMAIHEMATNAAKYGAFADDDGCLTISWRWQDDRLDFRWRESGVILGEMPERKGFGTTVIEHFISSALDAEVTRIVHDDGIEWRLLLSGERLRWQLPDATA